MIQRVAFRLTSNGGSIGLDSEPRAAERFLRSITAVWATNGSLCLANQVQLARPAINKIPAAMASRVRVRRCLSATRSFEKSR